jgi:predicted GIY-YIG superfamily endonuclease
VKNLYWTKDRCKQEALKYKTKTEFIKGSYSAYQRALAKKWLPEICSHMIPLGTLYKRCIYVFEFSNNHAYIGLTCNINKRRSEHLSKKGKIRKYIKEFKIIPTFVQLTNYVEIGKAQKLEAYWQRKYRRKGWILLNKAVPGGLGKGYLKWTKDKCFKEALKYKSKISLKKSNCSVYNAIIKNGWMSEMSKHMVRPPAHNKK